MAHNFEQINTVYGLYHMATDLGDVDPNTEIFLRQPDGTFLNLGTRAAVEGRVGQTALVGPPPGFPLLGFFGAPAVDDNLFVRSGVDAVVGADPVAAVDLAPAVAHGMAPDVGGRKSRRSRKRVRRSKKRLRCSRKH